MGTGKTGPERQSTPYLTTEDAARYLGLSAKSLINWRLARKGPRFVRISHRCVRYRLDDLQEWANSKQVETRESAAA